VGYINFAIFNQYLAVLAMMPIRGIVTMEQ